MTGYIINYKSQAGDWEEKKITGLRSGYVLNGLRCGTKYQISIIPYNRAGRAPSSDLLTSTTAGNGKSVLFVPFILVLKANFY